MGDGSGRDGSSSRSQRSGMGDLSPLPQEALPRPPPPGLQALTSLGKLRSEPPRCGQHRRPAGRPTRPGRGEGRRGSRGARSGEVRVRRGEGGTARRSRGPTARLGSGREERRGEGDGREWGRKQCSRRGPGRVPLPSAAAKGRFRSVAAGAVRRWVGGPRGSPRSTPRRLRRPRAGWAEELLAGGRPDGGAAERTPRWDPPQQDPQAGRGVGRSGRAAAARRRPNSAGPGLGWEEARRPGWRKRGPDPPPAAARLREGARRTCGGAWAGGVEPAGGAPCRAPGARREACPQALPPPASPR